MTWYVATYEFTSPFSLKSSIATSSGGKTLLLPTMYAFKMALLDAAYRTGLNGEEEFDWIKTLNIRFRPPQKACVQNAFVKIQRESRSEVKKERPDQCFTSTVALREYVIFDGELLVAVHVLDLTDAQKQKLETLMAHINQLGKRGGFVQFKAHQYVDRLDHTFTLHLQSETIQLPSSLMIQYLDDMPESARFPAVNTYDPSAAKMGKDRILVPIGVPYRLAKSSRSFSYYERVDQ